MWFGMLIAVTVMIGVVIPPVAMNVFVVKNITKMPFGVIYCGVVPFLPGPADEVAGIPRACPSRTGPAPRPLIACSVASGPPGGRCRIGA